MNFLPCYTELVTPREDNKTVSVFVLLFDLHYYLVPGKMDYSKTVSGDPCNGNFYMIKKKKKKKEETKSPNKSKQHNK